MDTYFNKKYSKNIYISNFTSDPIKKRNLFNAKNDELGAYSYYNLLKKIEGDEDL